MTSWSMLPRDCDACGDPAVFDLGGRPLCGQCYRELRYGHIAPPPRSAPGSIEPARPRPSRNPDKSRYEQGDQ